MPSIKEQSGLDLFLVFITWLQLFSFMLDESSRASNIWYSRLLGLLLFNQIRSFWNWLAMYGIILRMFNLLPLRKSPLNNIKYSFWCFLNWTYFSWAARVGCSISRSSSYSAWERCEVIASYCSHNWLQSTSYTNFFNTLPHTHAQTDWFMWVQNLNGWL